MPGIDHKKEETYKEIHTVMTICLSRVEKY